MITGHEKFRVPDINKSKDLLVEVNWTKDPKIKDCKVLKFIYPNGDEAYIKKEHFNAILFAIGNEKEQQKMIPQKITRVKHYETVVSVKAFKNVRKGENLTFPISISLPTAEEEIIGKVIPR